MKKNIVIAILVLVVVVFGGFLWVNFVSDEAGWVCDDGQWVEKGDTDLLQPTAQCLDEESIQTVKESVEQEVKVSEMIKIFYPQSNDIVSSPVNVSGEALSSWYFEANAGLQVVATDGTVLGEGNVMATEDWMQEGFVKFEGQLVFDAKNYDKGFVVFSNDNPSGLSENSLSYKVPVFFNKVPKTLTVKVFYANDQFDPEMLDCSNVYPVEREIDYTVAVAKASLSELLQGPTTLEQEAGYVTSINENVKINSIKIENRIAYVDFDEQLQYQVGGSCRVTSIVAQIKNTLKQFSSIDDVVISINGNSTEILQP